MHGTLGLIDIVATMLYGNTYKFQLPSNVYYACGHIAYKWLPYGAVGSCTLTRLIPATWVWGNKDLPYEAIPKHTLQKREEPLKTNRQLVAEIWVCTYISGIVSKEFTLY